MPVKSAKDLVQTAGLVAESVNLDALVPVDTRVPKKASSSAAVEAIDVFFGADLVWFVDLFNQWW